MFISLTAKIQKNMYKNAIVQTNRYGVNVLVETDKSNNRHYHHTNEEVGVKRVLTDKEIIALWEKRTDDDKLELAKEWIKTQEGYARSHCVDKSLNITYGSIVEYE